MDPKIKLETLFEVLMINASLCWWKTQMKNVIEAIETIEANPFFDTESDTYLFLQHRFTYLLQKGSFETRNITAFRKKMSKLS